MKSELVEVIKTTLDDGKEIYFTIDGKIIVDINKQKEIERLLDELWVSCDPEDYDSQMCRIWAGKILGVKFNQKEEKFYNAANIPFKK